MRIPKIPQSKSEKKSSQSESGENPPWLWDKDVQICSNLGRQMGVVFLLPVAFFVHVKWTKSLSSLFKMVGGCFACRVEILAHILTKGFFRLHLLLKILINTHLSSFHTHFYLIICVLCDLFHPPIRNKEGYVQRRS